MILRRTSVVFYTVLVLLTGFTHLNPSVHAQSFKPGDKKHPTYNYIDGQALFIAAGTTFGALGQENPRPLSQLSAMDLSVSWNTDNPKYNQLPDSPSIYYGPSAISSDGKEWVVISTNSAYIYSFESKTWSTLSIPSDFNTGGGQAVTDPETGLIYIPRVSTGNPPQYFTMRLNLTSRTYDRLAITNDDIQTIDDYAIAWSVSLRKLIYIGGKKQSSQDVGSLFMNMHIFSYSVNDGWRNITQEMKGGIPEPRYGACLLPALGGSKMVLFGGFFRTSDIYILDIATMTWTKGPDATDKTRAYPACAISNDHFVAWGGMTGSTPTANFPLNSTIVFNLKTNEWTSTYTAPGDSTGGLSPAIIITVVVLGVASLSLGAIFLRRKVKQKSSQNSDHTRDPQEPPANNEPVFKEYIPRNPQCGADQFPLQDFNAREPHAILSSRSPQDPLPATAITTDKKSRDHQDYKYSTHEAMSPSTLPSQTQSQVDCPQQNPSIDDALKLYHDPTFAHWQPQL